MPKIARLVLVSVLFAAACSDDEFQPPVIDAATDAAMVDVPGIDAIDATPIDADPDAVPIDARIDAMSTVMVVQCPGNPDLSISAATGAYVPSTGTISVNGVVRLTPGDPNHNMVSGSNNTPDGLFSTPLGQTTCLRFTATGTFPFYCQIHQFTGTITVQ